MIAGLTFLIISLLILRFALAKGILVKESGSGFLILTGLLRS
jgi:hypothetical protein